MGPMLAMIVMDGKGLEAVCTVDMSFICLLQLVVHEGDGEVERVEFYLVGVEH